jgi:hypothetical protein
MDNIFSNLLEQFEEKTDLIPAWASRNALSKSAYEAVIKKAQQIEERLKKTPRDLLDRLLVVEKQIVVAELAKEIGCTRAALGKSRRPELNEFIDKINVKLSAHYEINARRKSRDRKPRKDELEARCAQLEKEVDGLKQLKIGTLISDFFSSHVSEEHRLLVIKLESTQLELERYKERAFNQREKIDSLMKQADFSRLQLLEAQDQMNLLKAELENEKSQNGLLIRRVESLLNQLNTESK